MTWQRRWCAHGGVAWLLMLTACGGGSAATAPSYGGYERGMEPTSAGGAAPSATAEESYDFSDDVVSGDRVVPDGEMYAQAQPSAAPSAAGPQPPQTMPVAPQSPNTANDATPANTPLLIYEAQLYLAVYKVEENLKAVAKAGTDAGGFLSRQDDRSVVIRVPAAKFHEVVAVIEALGDVLHRQVQATDVSEEFRDVEIRIRNALQVRERLAELLTRASKVEESLQIERELERITGELERLKGRMRFLQDRIAFSTITVSFQPKEQENLNNNAFRLPFPWLDSLGLQRLLSL